MAKNRQRARKRQSTQNKSYAKQGGNVQQTGNTLQSESGSSEMNGQPAEGGLTEESVQQAESTQPEQGVQQKDSSANKEKTALFREKNLERIENPEKLNDYLRVTSPGVWLVMATVIILLIGVCIWGVFGRITSTVTAVVVSKDDETRCLVPANALEAVLNHRTITIDGEEHTLEPSVLEPEVISENTDVYVMLAGKLSVGDIVYPISLSDKLDEGIYSGKLVTETLSPASLFLSN